MNAKINLLFLVCAAFVLTCAKKDDQSNTDRQYVTASGGLNMRNAPQTGAQAVLLIPQNAEVIVLERAGEEVEIGGRKGKWTKVRYNSQEGWVFGGFLVTLAGGGDLAGLLKNGGCIPFSFEGGRCSFNQGAPCYEGAQLRVDGTAFLGGCEAGENGTWVVSGKRIIITSSKARSAACKTDCWFQSYDPDKAAACEVAQQCASLTGADQKTSVLEQQSDGSFMLLPATKMGQLQQPQ